MIDMGARKIKKTHIDESPPWQALLSDWRKWLLGALLGALVAVLLFSIAPPNYRAQATVVVDQNIEEAWTYFPDRQLFQFVRRETARLVALAWSDSVLDALPSAEFTKAELRDQVLQLSQPSDGAWHFYANHANAQSAADLANAWAQAFVDGIGDGLVAAPEMQAARQSLNDLVLNDPDPNNAELLALLNQITELAESTKGLSPYLEVYLSQSASIAQERNPSQASYVFIGATIGLLFGWLTSLLRVDKGARKE